MHASRSVNERSQILQEAKAILDQARDFGSRTRADLLGQLSEAYSSTPIKKSAAFAEQAVAIYRRGPPGSDRAAVVRFGIAYSNVANFAGASQAFAEAIEVSL